MKQKERISKKLRGIKPFNKFMFISCFYHQLIAAYHHFGVGEQLILMNYYSLYCYDVDKKTYDLKTNAILSPPEMEKLTGLHHVYKKYSENIVSETVHATERGLPVIVCVDGFELPYREDTYHKIHAPHFILIYGFDKDQNEFTINEHMFENSLQYVERTINFKELYAAHESFQKYCQDRIQFGLLKIRKIGDLQQDIRPLTDSRRDPEEIENSLLALENCMKHIQYCMGDEKFCLENVSKLIHLLGDFRWKKTSQKYQMIYLKTPKEMIDCVDRVIENYIFIYGILAKIQFTKVFHEMSVKNVCERCAEVIRLERVIHDFYLEDNRS